MPRTVFLFLLACGAPGCLHPLSVVTKNEVAVEPLAVRGTLAMPPAVPGSSGGRVVEMPLDGGDCRGSPRVALLDVDGLLVDQNMTGPGSFGENPVALFAEKLEAAAAAPGVCAVVLRINSPGGGVAATDMMWQELQRFRARTRLPVVACLMDVGAGGAYYLATAADQIVAHPGTITGGIGVIWNSYNLADLMAQYNIIPQPVRSGPRIDMGSSARAIPADTRKLLQQIADEFHQRFKAVVRQARPGLKPADDGLLDGRVFTAGVAARHGLIDRVGYLPDAVGLARDLARQPGAPVVLFHRPTDPAYSAYAVTPNQPLQNNVWPVNLPGLERSRLPTFLYMWQPDPSLERLGPS